MAAKYYKEESKKEWYTEMAITNNDLQTGALMRIADATEKMASNYVRMENDLAMYKRWYEAEKACTATLVKRNSALKGYLNRLKKQISK